jgi:hypothetical protein
VVTPLALAEALIGALAQWSITAGVGQAVQSGQKVTVADRRGKPAGNLIVYVGKRGATLVRRELTQADAELQAHIDVAWKAVTDANDRPADIAPCDTAATAYAQALAELASRASMYAPCSGLDWSDLWSALTDLATTLGQPVPPDLSRPDGTAPIARLTNFAETLVARSRQGSGHEPA